MLLKDDRVGVLVQWWWRCDDGAIEFAAKQSQINFLSESERERERERKGKT